MINRSALCILFISACTLFSCKDNEESNMQYEEQMKDSIYKYYPTVAGITIGLHERTKLDITLGSPDMFKKSEEEREKTANELGVMALKIFPKNNDINKGQLILSKEEHVEHINIADCKTSTINFDSLRKAMAKQ